MFASCFRCMCLDINCIQGLFFFTAHKYQHLIFVILPLSLWGPRITYPNRRSPNTAAAHCARNATLTQDLPLHLQTLCSMESTHSQSKDTQKKPESEHPLCGVIGAEWSPAARREGLLQFNAGIQPLFILIYEQCFITPVIQNEGPWGLSCQHACMCVCVCFLIVLASCVGHDKLARGWNGKLCGHPFLWNSMMFPGLADKKFWQQKAACRGMKASYRITAWPDLPWTVPLCNTEGFNQHPLSPTVVFFLSSSWRSHL